MKAKVVVIPCEYKDGFVQIRISLLAGNNDLLRAVEEFPNVQAVRERVEELHRQFDGKHNCQIHIWAMNGSRKVPGFDKVMDELHALTFCHAAPAPAPAPSDEDGPGEFFQAGDPDNCITCRGLGYACENHEKQDDPIDDFNYVGSRHHY
jgi:hypothetical protein